MVQVVLVNMAAQRSATVRRLVTSALGAAPTDYGQMAVWLHVQADLAASGARGGG